MQTRLKGLLPSAVALSVMVTAIAADTTASSAAPIRSIPGATSLQNDMVQDVRWRGHRHGGAVAAGVIGGLALGAMLGAAAAAPPPPPPVYYEPDYGPDDDWLAYCASKYRSFDPATGTFMGYDGIRRPCR